jgi:16S rRNA (guanine527-N7)-methyltransferase
VTDVLAGLLEESRRLGFLGPGSIDGHIDHARAFAVAVGEPPAHAVDLGAGGGLPGLVLATLVWPGTSWVFLDVMARRTAFLREAVDAAGLAERVTVVTERAEAYGRRGEARHAFDLVVARSFGPPAVTAECAAPLLRPGGLLVVSEPPTSADALRWPAGGLAELGLGEPEFIEVTADRPVHLVRISCVGPCPDRYPRRVGIPAKRPLF